MFSIETVIFISAVVLCLVALIGAVISRTIVPPSNQKSLESQLLESRQDLEKYQQEVAHHFAETSKLVTNLTESYKAVHDHLSKGAVLLTTPSISQKMMQAGSPELGIESKDDVATETFEPPKDWAPKTPGQDGVLSEQFGLSENENQEEAPFDPSHVHRT